MMPARDTPPDVATSPQMAAMPAAGTAQSSRSAAGYTGSGCAGRGRTGAAVPGRPDLAGHGAKVAVFVDGCFWHRCALRGSGSEVADRREVSSSAAVRAQARRGH